MIAQIDITVDGRPAPIVIESGYLAIRESIDFFIPTAELHWSDMLSSFVSVYPFMQDSLVNISLDDGSTRKEYKFIAFSSRKDITPSSGTESYDFNLDLISKNVKSLLTDSEYHSDKLTASDYVKYIADKCSLKSDVEVTNEVRNFINPGWKYGQMIRYLAQRSISKTGSGGYLYFVKNDNTLVFKSIDKLFSDSEEENITACIYPEQGESNKDLVFKDNHFANVTLGANRLKLRSYDFNTETLIEEDIDYSVYLKKRGDVKGVAVDYTKIGNDIYAGEWYSGDNDKSHNFYRFLYNKILRQLESSQVQITAPLKLGREIGNIVNLSVPANSDMIDGGVNLNYSGRYLIKSILTKGHGEFYQTLTLVRPGISLPTERKSNYF